MQTTAKLPVARDAFDVGFEHLVGGDGGEVFPTHLLPHAIAEQVRAVAETYQVPEALPGMLALGVLSAAAARTAVVSPYAGWREPLNVFVCAVLPPGSRKSACFREMLEPLLEYEQQMVANFAGQRAELETKRKWAEVQQKKTWERIEKGAGDGSEMAEEAVERAVAVADAAVPPPPRMVADDVTPERVATLLAENGGRICIASPEADIFEIMRGRYSKQANIGVFLKGHAGDTLRVDRQTRAPVLVHDPALTMILAVQPRAIEDLDKGGEMRGRGLVARFLFSVPDNNVGERSVEFKSIPERTRAAYNAVVRDILRRKVCDQPPVIGFDFDSARVFKGFLAGVERRLGERGGLYPVVDWGSKFAGAVARIAGVLVLASGRHEVTPVDIERAIGIGESLVSHANIAFRMIRGDGPAGPSLRAIVRAILFMGATQFSARDLTRQLSRLMSPDECKRLLQRLADMGWLTETSTTPRNSSFEVALPMSVFEAACEERRKGGKTREKDGTFAASSGDENGACARDVPVAAGGVGEVVCATN